MKTGIVSFIIMLGISLIFCQVVWEYAFVPCSTYTFSFGTGVAETRDGYFVVSENRGNAIKLTYNGEIVWSKFLRYMAFDMGAFRVVESADGNLLFVGPRVIPTWDSVLVGPDSFWADTFNAVHLGLICTNDDGEVVWEKNFSFIGGIHSAEAPSSVVSTPDGGFAVAGFVGGGPWSGGNALFLICFSDSGETLWTRIFDISSYDYNYPSLIVTSDGGFAMASVVGFPNPILVLFRLDGDGNLLWQREYHLGFITNDRVYSMITEIASCPQKSKGFALCVGWSATGVCGDSVHFMLITVDTLGDTVWTKTYYPGLQLCGLITTDNGDFILAGGGGLVLRVDSLGSVIGVFDSLKGDVNYISKCSDGNIILVGRPSGYYFPFGSIYVAKIDPTEILSNVSETRKSSPPLFLFISPSPFNSSCFISAPAGAEIEIYDIGGRLVWSSPFYGASGNNYQRDNSSHRKIVWKPDGSVKSGIYFVRAKIGGQAITKRVVLIR